MWYTLTTYMLDFLCGFVADKGLCGRDLLLLFIAAHECSVSIKFLCIIVV